jgi:hypothetical protein
VNANPVTANAYVFLCYENDNTLDSVGIGYTGSTCNSLKQYRTSIAEYYFTDFDTSQVIYLFISVSELTGGLKIYSIW